MIKARVVLGIETSCDETSAAVLRHLQADPLLPEDLLWMGWPGTALRDDYDVYDRAYRSLLRDWFRH